MGLSSVMKDRQQSLLQCHVEFQCPTTQVMMSHTHTHTQSCPLFPKQVKYSMKSSTNLFFFFFLRRGKFFQE